MAEEQELCECLDHKLCLDVQNFYYQELILTEKEFDFIFLSSDLWRSAKHLFNGTVSVIVYKNKIGEILQLLYPNNWRKNK